MPLSDLILPHCTDSGIALTTIAFNDFSIHVTKGHATVKSTAPVSYIDNYNVDDSDTPLLIRVPPGNTVLVRWEVGQGWEGEKAGRGANGLEGVMGVRLGDGNVGGFSLGVNTDKVGVNDRSSRINDRSSRISDDGSSRINDGSRTNESRGVTDKFVKSTINYNTGDDNSYLLVKSSSIHTITETKKLLQSGNYPDLPSTVSVKRYRLNGEERSFNEGTLNRLNDERYFGHATGLASVLERDSIHPGLITALERESIHPGLVPALEREFIHRGLATALERDSIHPGLVPASEKESIHSGLVTASEKEFSHSGWPNDHNKPNLINQSIEKSDHTGLVSESKSFTLNDEFNPHSINSKVTFSLWQLSEDLNLTFLLNFSVWIDPPVVYKSTLVTSDSTTDFFKPDIPFVNGSENGSCQNLNSSPINGSCPNFNTFGFSDSLPATPTEEGEPQELPKRSPQKPKLEETLEGLKIADVKKQFSFSIEDGPDFRKSILKYNSNLLHYNKSCLRLLEELRILQARSASLIRLKSKCLDLVRSIINYQFNPILKQLGVSQALEKKINLVFEPVEKNIQFIIEFVCNIALVQKMCQTLSVPLSKDVKIKGDTNDVLEHARKTFETNSKEYYNWLNKYLSNEKGKTESKLLSKRKEFELSKFDYLNHLNTISNNQYMNSFLEGLFKFVNLPIDERGYLDFELYKDARTSYSLISEQHKTYLALLSRFNSEKLKFRQMIEACKTNEELNETINYNPLDHSKAVCTALDDNFVDQDNIDSVFANSLLEDTPASLYKDADMTGILYTLGGKGKPGWHKEWIVLKNGQLMEFSDWRHGKTPINTPIEIALCNVKQVNVEKRQNCFEVNTSTGSRHVFQALNAEEVSKWMSALYHAGQVVDTKRLKNNIKAPQPSRGKLASNVNDKKRRNLVVDTTDVIIPGSSGDRSISPVSVISKTIKEVNHLQLVRSIPDSDNIICADCGSKSGVDWVSINFLCVLCVDCASCHRNLGSHISKIRSLKLDKFDEEVQYLFKYTNNRHLNSILENYSNTRKPDITTNQQERLEYIKAKYVLRTFTSKIPNVENYLIKSIQRIEIPRILEAIFSGANVNLQIQINVPGDVETKVVSLLEYSLRKYLEIEGIVPVKRVFIVSELLILNGCKINKVTNEGFNNLKLLDEAVIYWQDKVRKIAGK